MKKILTGIAVLALAFSFKAQVVIGAQDGTQAADNASVSLQFTNQENKGLILPYVEQKGEITEEGTVILDATDSRVKYYNGNWVDLSYGTEALLASSVLAIQSGKNENTEAKTAIGANADTDTTDGILVLTDTDKAMILPKVAEPHKNIINPAPGMMVYDTTNHLLAIYDGTVWSFLKPKKN